MSWIFGQFFINVHDVFGDFRYHILLMYLATPGHQLDVGGATYIQPQQLQLIS